MKKRIAAIFLAAALAFSLASCSSGSSSSSSASSGSSSSSAPAKVTSITIPTYYVGENVGAVYFEPAVERFNEKYAGQYEVKLESVVEDSYSDKMKQLAATGKLPILLSGVNNDFINTIFLQQKLYYPMNDWLDSHPDVKNLLLDGSLEYSTQENGDIVGIPSVYVSSMGLFYNSALYNPGKSVASMSVDEFVQSLGDNKLAFQTVDNAWTSMLFITCLIANEDGGAALLQQYDGDKLYDYNQTCIINALDKFKEVWDSNAASNSLGSAYADAANTFMSNGAAVIFNGSWMNSEFGSDASDKWSNDFDGADVKADYYPGNISIAGEKGYGRWFVTNNYSSQEELDCALAFMEFIYSQDELETFILAEGGQAPKMTYSDSFKVSLAEDQLISDQTTLVNDETVFVPSFASIMPSSVANDVFANELVQFVNGSITAEDFCQILTTKAEEAKA